MNRNKTKRVLKTDKSVSSGKTRIHSKELQLSDFHHKLNVSSLADLWQTHKRSMLKNKTQSEKWHATSSGAGRPSLQCISIPALVFAIWFVRSPCIPVQTQSLIKIEGHTLLDIRIADGRTCTARPVGVADLFTCATDHTRICLRHWLAGWVPHSRHALHLSEKILSQTTNQLCLK